MVVEDESGVAGALLVVLLLLEEGMVEGSRVHQP